MPVLKETVHTSTGSFDQGCELPDDHPLVKSAPQLFDGISAPKRARTSDVEQATKAPGTKRNR